MCIPLLAGYTFQTHHVLKLKASLFPQLPKLLLSLILLSLKGTLIYTYHGILIACKPVFSTNSKILEDKECYLIRVSTPSLTQYLPNPINVNLKIDHWDFHGGLECKTSHFQCRGHVFVPGHGTNIPHAGWGGQKQNKHQQQNSKNWLLSWMQWWFFDFMLSSL